MHCSKALKGATVKLPNTVMMHEGLTVAIFHLRYGIPIHFVYNMQWKSIEKYGLSYGELNYFYIDSGKLVYEHPSMTRHQRKKVQADLKDHQPINEEVALELQKLKDSMFLPLGSTNHSIQVVSNTAIQELYPIHSDVLSCLKSPLNILVDGRRKLAELAVLSPGSCSNKQMLKIVNTIRSSELDTCTSLLGGFMHQTVVNIPLTSNRQSQVFANGKNVMVKTPASIGVWALFSLDYDRVQTILSECHDEQLLIKLFDYVKGISGISLESELDESYFNPYAAKLQFIVQGMAKTVTCDTQHVSYSLERQLVELCNEQNIHATIPLSIITGKWSTLFRGKTLSLVCHNYRLLIAHWLKWALMIHNLREELAKYTAVGVVGLVNSGKSKLVNTLFGIKVYIAISI